MSEPPARDQSDRKGKGRRHESSTPSLASSESEQPGPSTSTNRKRPPPSKARKIKTSSSESQSSESDPGIYNAQPLTGGFQPGAPIDRYSHEGSIASRVMEESRGHGANVAKTATKLEAGLQGLPLPDHKAPQKILLSSPAVPEKGRMSARNKELRSSLSKPGSSKAASDVKDEHIKKEDTTEEDSESDDGRR